MKPCWSSGNFSRARALAASSSLLCLILMMLALVPNRATSCDACFENRSSRLRRAARHAPAVDSQLVPFLLAEHLPCFLVPGDAVGSFYESADELGGGTQGRETFR
jgi:hypothetical protein